MSAIQATLESLGYSFTGGGSYLRCIEHDSLVINTSKDVFYWNSKGIGGNAYQFLTKISNMSSMEALKYLETLGVSNERTSYSPTPKNIIFPSRKQMEYLSRRAEYYHKTLLNDPDRLEYWFNQGINSYSIHKFKLGWAFECPIVPNIDSFTIPFIKGNDIINIKHRLNVTKADKYRPEMAGLSNYLFNVDGLYRQDGINWPGDAVLLEGEKKAIVFQQHGFRTASISGGNAWKSQYIREFSKANINFVYVVLDPGMEEQADKIAHEIRKGGGHSKSVYLSDKPDDIIINGQANAQDILYEMHKG